MTSTTAHLNKGSILKISILNKHIKSFSACTAEIITDSNCGFQKHVGYWQLLLIFGVNWHNHSVMLITIDTVHVIDLCPFLELRPCFFNYSIDNQCLLSVIKVNATEKFDLQLRLRTLTLQPLISRNKFSYLVPTFFLIIFWGEGIKNIKKNSPWVLISLILMTSGVE